VAKTRPILLAWLRRGLSALMLAWLALAAQIALGGSLPADTLTRALANAVIDCDGAGLPPPASHHHHAPDGIVISVLALASAVVAIAAANLVLPIPLAILLGSLVRLPPARAPPARTYLRPPSHAPPAEV
jgi:hypothetical protein